MTNFKNHTQERPLRRASLTSEKLQERFSYCPDTGEFRMKVARGPVKAGQVAGTLDGEGRTVIMIDYVQYFASRLAWLYMTGSWPQGEVDHRDTDATNDRWLNLRDVTSAINKQNIRRVQSGKRSSQLLGAQWSKQLNKWQSSIRVNGKRKHLGFFKSDVEASHAYLEAKRKFHEGCTL